MAKAATEACFIARWKSCDEGSGNTDKAALWDITIWSEVSRFWNVYSEFGVGVIFENPTAEIRFVSHLWIILGRKMGKYAHWGNHTEMLKQIFPNNIKQQVTTMNMSLGKI